MFTRIDHIMICVPDLERGTDQYRRMGFNVHTGGVHPGKGTHNAIALNQDDYIELLAIHNPAELRTAAAGPGSAHAGLEQFIAAGGGIRYVILQSDDLAADVAAMRARGVDVSDVMDGNRRTPAGLELRWKSATLGPQNPLPLFFIQHQTPMAERRKQAPDAGEHPNGVRFLERTYIVVQDLEAAVAIYAKVLGIPEPRKYKGTVIMSHMAVFQFGPAGLTIAHPYAPGPAADALARRGPGAFQALYRTTSMGAAMRWMQEHGMPPPAHGVRDTGEHAILVPPAEACGAYIGFVGPE
jgi:catechol 2,3-dioxygenase-like lactoylglutathione lyase family enzyme